MVDFKTRLVALENLTLVGGEPGGRQRRALESVLQQAPLHLELDTLLQALPADFEVPQQASVRPQLNFQPPRIVVSTSPMRLLLIDGPPAPVGIVATDLEFVVNTDWDIFHDTRSDRWFILDDGYWIANTMLSSGDWLNTTDLPRDFLNLQVNSEWPAVAAAMPPRKAEKRPLPITISYEPTELVIIDGDARFAPIGGSGLQYVTNTESDLFGLGAYYYYLAAGAGSAPRASSANGQQ